MVLAVPNNKLYAFILDRRRGHKKMCVTTKACDRTCPFLQYTAIN